MALTLAEKLTVTALSKLLYNFLPASGNNSTSFPLAAAEAGIPESWPTIGCSKGPGIERMLTWTLTTRRDRMPQLVDAIISQSVSYRIRNNPLSRNEVCEAEQLFARLGVDLPALRDRSFLESLPVRDAGNAAAGAAPTTTPAPAVAPALLQALERRHVELAALAPQPRGYAFEKFLSDMFDAYALAPRGSFRIVGEQIDGSFRLDHETYLLEAKWVNAPVGAEDLYAFTGKVQNRASWARGVFISNSGFSRDGLTAYGKRNPVICVDGYDLNEILRRQLPFDEVLRAKVRRAAETGNPLVHVRDLPLDGGQK